MDAIIRARGRICEDPDHDPDTPRTGHRIFGDHIHELRDGGAMFDARNIMLRCGSCHSRKTAAERAKRMKTPGGGLKSRALLFSNRISAHAREIFGGRQPSEING